MSKSKDGGHAFGALASTPDGDVHGTSGMSLRDYLAGQVLAACDVQTEMAEVSGEYWYQPWQIAERCYAIADAMIARRAKP